MNQNADLSAGESPEIERPAGGCTAATLAAVGDAAAEVAALRQAGSEPDARLREILGPLPPPPERMEAPADPATLL